MPDYEVLLDAGSSGILREAADYTEAIAGADLGNAYHASAIIGEVAGILRWTLTWKQVHRDKVTYQAKTYNNVNIGSAMTRLKYLEAFVARRVAAGNNPFWFYDVDHPVVASRRLTMCRLIEPVKLLQTQDGKNSLLWSYSLKFQQIRGAPAQS